jgi:hypothetical protein
MYPLIYALISEGADAEGLVPPVEVTVVDIKYVPSTFPVIGAVHVKSTLAPLARGTAVCVAGFKAPIVAVPPLIGTEG